MFFGDDVFDLEAEEREFRREATVLAPATGALDDLTSESG